MPESIRFELTGALRPGVTAKDVMLYILANHAKQQLTLDSVMEFGGPGLASLSPDERATLANMATECRPRRGIVEADDATLAWLAARRPGSRRRGAARAVVAPDRGAEYAGGVHTIDLVDDPADGGDARRSEKGIPSDPTNGAYVSRDRRRPHRHRLRRLVHRRQEKTTSTCTRA